jgi:hypothetical protein
MREQSPNHSDPIPNAENWILVSDPFERPKVYRHKNAILRIDENSQEQSGVFIYVIREPKQAPLILHDIRVLQMGDRIIKGSYFSLYAPPVLRIIINDDPIEIGKSFPIFTDYQGFISIPNHFKHSADITHLDRLRNLKDSTPFRLKIESTVNPDYQEDNPPSFRGTLNADAVLALRQAVALYDHFQGTP